MHNLLLGKRFIGTRRPAFNSNKNFIENLRLNKVPNIKPESVGRIVENLDWHFIFSQVPSNTNYPVTLGKLTPLGEKHLCLELCKEF
jgi:hypothetical protein